MKTGHHHQDKDRTLSLRWRQDIITKTGHCQDRTSSPRWRQDTITKMKTGHHHQDEDRTLSPRWRQDIVTKMKTGHCHQDEDRTLPRQAIITKMKTGHCHQDEDRTLTPRWRQDIAKTGHHHQDEDRTLSRQAIVTKMKTGHHHWPECFPGSPQPPPWWGSPSSCPPTCCCWSLVPTRWDSASSQTSPARTAWMTTSDSAQGRGRHLYSFLKKGQFCQQCLGPLMWDVQVWVLLWLNLFCTLDLTCLHTGDAGKVSFHFLHQNHFNNVAETQQHQQN